MGEAMDEKTHMKNRDKRSEEEIKLAEQGKYLNTSKYERPSQKLIKTTKELEHKISNILEVDKKLIKDNDIRKKEFDEKQFALLHAEEVTKQMQENYKAKLKEKENWAIEQQRNNFDDLDDEEIDDLIVDKEEEKFREEIWDKLNGDYMKAKAEKEKLLKDKEPRKHKKIGGKNAKIAAQSLVNQRRMSKKINYDVLGELLDPQKMKLYQLGENNDELHTNNPNDNDDDEKIDTEINKIGLKELEALKSDNTLLKIGRMKKNSITNQIPSLASIYRNISDEKPHKNTSAKKAKFDQMAPKITAKKKKKEKKS